MPINIPDDDIEWGDTKASTSPAKPADLRQFARSEAIRQNVDPSHIEAIFKQESRFNPNARSPKGAIGVAQLMPGTARDLGVDPTDPYQNISGGIRYYKQQLDKFKDPVLARAAYNAGPGAVQRYGGVPPYAETQDYVRKTEPVHKTNMQQIPDDDIEWESTPAQISANQTDRPSSQVEVTEQPRTRTIGEQIKRTAGLATRDILSGVTGAAGLIADVPYRLGRVAGIGEHLKLPSERFQEGMTQLGLPEVETTTEKATGLATSILAGGMIDPVATGIQRLAGGGKIRSPSPPAPVSERARIIQEGMKEGFVVTPGQAAAGKGGRTLEAFASRPRVEQHAQFLNQFKANDLARRDLNFPEDVPLTRTTINKAREDVLERGYRPIEDLDFVATGQKYRDALHNITLKYSESIQGVSDSPNAEAIKKLVDSHNQMWFSGKQAVNSIKLMREEAGEAFRKGDHAIGRAKQDLANAIENAIETNLEARKMPDLMKRFKDARQWLAKSYDVEDTLEAGDVNVKDMVKKLENNVPLSGGLRTIAEVAQAAPRNFAKPGVNKPPMFDVWDIALGSGGMMTGGLPYIGLIGARTGIRNLLMTQPIQRSVMFPKPSRANAISGSPFIGRATPTMLQQGIFGPFNDE